MCWEELAEGVGLGAEWDMEGELLVGLCIGMVSEGKGQSVNQFLGSCSVTDRSRQACRAVIAAPRDMPRVATNSLSLLSDL